jgi:hypothetical protein
MIRAGKSFAEVEAKMAVAETSSNIVFGDHEIFQLIVELVKAGNKVGLNQGILKGKYHCTVDLLFDWFGLVCFAN